MKRQHGLHLIFFAVAVALSCPRLQAVDWLPFGPNGGDARSIVADPSDHAHLFLGGVNGWIYESRNGGAAWKRLARVGKRDDLVLDEILVDDANPKHILVGAWVPGSKDGGLFVSKDGGMNWVMQPQLAGQSVLSLTVAPSDHKVLVAGTLQGVYRSTDAGLSWKRISEEGSQELHEIESLAIDPVDPQIIYAGTWHLPWKTVDGGEHWTNIKQGVIDDSDVFSIIVDPKDPLVVYASACSGIYKSENGGEKFAKVQGIPSTARRTRVLMQDPQHLNVVYAGTTEGLFKTEDSGKSWTRTTGPEVIVNDVYVDPTASNHLVVATDRGGVLVSEDGGTTFLPANEGFSARQITSYQQDAQHGLIYVGVVNDKEWGGVFSSDNGGLTWTQRSGGLGGRDVFSLGMSSNGTLLAGTGHGIYMLSGDQWARVEDSQEKGEGVSSNGAEKKVSSAKVVRRVVQLKGRRADTKSGSAQETGTAVMAAKLVGSDGSVYAMATAGDAVYAATSAGILRSVTAGKSWSRVEGLAAGEWRFVAAAKQVVVAATLRSAMMSSEGKSWIAVKLPEELKQLAAVAVDGSGRVWVGGGEGVFSSEDAGKSWQTLPGLALRDVNSLFYDVASQQVLLTTNRANTIAYSVHLPERTVQYWSTGWNLRLVRPVGDHLVAATLFDGMVVQPRMVDSPLAAH